MSWAKAPYGVELGLSWGDKRVLYRRLSSAYHVKHSKAPMGSAIDH